MIKEVINNKFYNIKKLIMEMSKVQKLILSIILVLIIFFISKIIPVLFDDDDVRYDYKKDDITIYYLLQNQVMDDNVIVTLKSIAEDFFGKTKQYYDGKQITISNLYDECLTDEYKSNISKSDFTEKYNQALDKVNSLRSINGELFPDKISIDEYGYYILKFSNNTEETEIELYMGISLDTSNHKYYIWYLQ